VTEMGNAGQERAEDGLEGAGGYPGNPQSVLEALRGSGVHVETEVHGALTVVTAGPVPEGLPLAPLVGVTDWGPWAQHNVPCPVCKERHAVVNLAGWVFGPCGECRREGWELRPPGRKRWWERLTRRR